MKNSMETLQIRLMPRQIREIDAEIKRLRKEGFSWRYANRGHVIRGLVENALVEKALSERNRKEAGSYIADDEYVGAEKEGDGNDD